MKKILVTGMCTLHWGRLEFGNVGNYYIIEPLFRLLHCTFPEYELLTTFQMSSKFVKNENVIVLPMEYYYAWRGNQDLMEAQHDVKNANEYVTKSMDKLSKWNDTVNQCELLINVSGDMWGDNAEAVGKDRLLVDCLKMQAAQILGCKTILYAVTPGPFTDTNIREQVKDTFTKFDKVFIREQVSEANLVKWGIPIDNVKWAPCPSYLFEANNNYRSKWTDLIIRIREQKCQKVIGMTFGGFNMPEGPYDMWPRDESQYYTFVNYITHMLDSMPVDIILFSHTNGFDLPPNFKLKSGRDYLILNQFKKIVCKKYPKYIDRLHIIDEPLLPCNLKKIIGSMDMLVTGRVHASVAATSQFVPTIYMEYDQNVIYSDKMSGFSGQIGMQRFVCRPNDIDELKEKTKECYEHLGEIQADLKMIIPRIQRQAISAINEMREIIA